MLDGLGAFFSSSRQIHSRLLVLLSIVDLSVTCYGIGPHGCCIGGFEDRLFRFGGGNGKFELLFIALKPFLRLSSVIVCWKCLMRDSSGLARIRRQA
jgi:hypothetical protein